MKKSTKIIIISIVCVVVLLLLGVLGYFIYLKSTYISKDVVKEIILNDTKLNEKDITFKDIDLDIDDGLHVYDVEFYYNKVEYSYEIDAKTGKIITSDFINTSLNNTPENGNNTPNANANEKNKNYITKEEARDVAISDAGFTLDTVTVIKAEFDYDNGLAVYEVEFINNNIEYEYEINAISKEIVSKKQERR